MSSEQKVKESSLHDQLVDENVSAMKRYQRLVVGTESFLYLIKFELINLFVTGLPGALGIVLRKWLMPTIIGSVGRNVVFGRGLTIRHGQKIHIGDNTVIDDNVTLDAKGEGNTGILLGNDSMLSRNTILACKNGDIRLGDRCMLGINTLIHAVEGCNVSLGDDVLVAANVYIVGSGEYGTSELDIPFKKQGIYIKGGITIAHNVWIGSNAQILDGVHIGTGAIVGSSALVNRNIREYDVVGGVPARKLRSRREDKFLSA